MAYLNKDAYDAKREWSAKRMSENAKIDTLTKEQHEALATLCEFRHKLHCNQESLFITGSCNYKPFWDEIFDESTNENNILNTFKKLNLGVPFTAITCDDAIDNDYDFNDYEDYDENGNIIFDANIDDDEKRQEKYDYNLVQVIDIAARINDEIEAYLQKIDEKHKTNYCPSGNGRLY